MEVFVTGGSGYIGQATIAALGSAAMSFAKIHFAAGHFEERQGPSLDGAVQCTRCDVLC